MATDIDSLQIQINAKAQKANSVIDTLVTKLDKLTTSLANVDGSKLSGLASGVSQLGSAMQVMNGVKTADFTRLAKNLSALNSIDTSQLSNVSANIASVGTSLSGLTNVSDGAKQLSEIANGIKQLGYKSAGQAIKNIPQLATAMNQLMSELSKAPTVSQNLIDMTNALAKLARTGASSGKAATSLAKSLDTYSTSAKTAKTHSFNLASAIGKVYATYWMLFRAAGKVKDAINISSDLTEVQNVVDVTFGKYASLVEDMSKTSIEEFGMSELTVKEVSSRFQSMGTAMGFTQGKMADMSIELTKLTADMASFYNVEQKDVAQDLESVFTGQTRPLRTYGLDLTEATLKEWALKNGLDANISAMSQAEKTMLRYQYVLANTGAAQGDFARTADTWANSVRILKQNFEALGATIGGTFINFLKPVVKALNVVIGKLRGFAKAVSNSLGVIFGWQYEESGGGVASDLEDAEGASGGLSDNLGDAANNAKKLKSHLLAIDELNVVEPDTDTSGSGGSGSGGGGASGGADGGQWTKVDSILKNYESELDTLYKLGEYIGDSLTSALNNIPWKSIYEKARNFGTGLADFLNGLISPELFAAVGRTIASALNTAIYAALSFGENFEFEELGLSIATGINEFFATFDFGSLADTIDVWVQGIWETIRTAFVNIKWGKVFGGIFDFFDDIDLGTYILFSIPNIKKISSAWQGMIEKCESLVKDSSELVGAFKGNKKSVETLMKKYPKLGKTVDVVSDSFWALKTGISDKNFGSGINLAIENIRNNLTMVQKGATIAASSFAEFNVVSSVFEGLKTGSESVLGAIAKIGTVAGVAAATMYTALGPAGLAITAITGVVAAIKGISDAEKQMAENSEIEKYGDTISNITERINESAEATKKRAGSAMEYVETAGLAETAMASDLADKYFDLAEKERLTNEEKEAMGNIAETLVGMLPELSDCYDEERRTLDATRESVDELINSRLKEIQLAAIEDKVKEAYEQQFDAMSDLEEATTLANDAQSEMNRLNQEFKDLTSKMDLLSRYQSLSDQINMSYGDTDDLLQKQEEIWNELTNNGADEFPTFDNLQSKLMETQTEISGFEETYESTMSALSSSKEAYDAVGNNISKLTEMLTTGMTDAAKDSASGFAEEFSSDKTMSNSTLEQAQDLLDAFRSRNGIDSHSPSRRFKEAGEDSVSGYVLGLTRNKSEITQEISNITSEIVNGIRKTVDPMYGIGHDAMQGLYNGLSGMEESLYAKAQSIADNIAKTIKKALDINSPSRVMFELGEYTIEGLKEGMESLYQPTIESLKGFSYNVQVAPMVTSFQDSSYVYSHSADLPSRNYGNEVSVDIKQAIREVISEMLTPYLSDIAESNREVADKDFSVEIGDRDIYRASLRGAKAAGRLLVT